MKKQTFMSRFGGVNEIWASEVLRIPLYEKNGPDLMDNKKLVEVKFCDGNNVKKYDFWKAHEHQKDYEKNFNLLGFWGVGIYYLDRKISSIDSRIKDKSKLEKFVQRRDLYLVQWDWANYFTFHPQENGDIVANLKKNKLPKIISSYDVKKGKVHLTEGVDERYFSNLI